MYFPNEMPIKSFIALNNKYEKTQPITVASGHFHSITFRLSGKKVITDENGRTFVSEKGSITYLPKNVAYSSDAIEGGNMYSVHFELEHEDPLSEAFVFLPKIVSSAVFENTFKELCESYSVSSPCNYRCTSLLYSIFDMIKRETEQAHGTPVPKRMADAHDTVDRCFNDANLSVSHLAAEAGVSETYFRREFKKCFGMSPIDYIRSVRIENSKLMLKSGLYQISEIATGCGFDSISYFSSTFKALCGINPTQYAKQSAATDIVTTDTSQCADDNL